MIVAKLSFLPYLPNSPHSPSFLGPFYCFVLCLVADCGKIVIFAIFAKFTDIFSFLPFLLLHTFLDISLTLDNSLPQSIDHLHVIEGFESTLHVLQQSLRSTRFFANVIVHLSSRSIHRLFCFIFFKRKTTTTISKKQKANENNENKQTGNDKLQLTVLKSSSSLIPFV